MNFVPELLLLLVLCQALAKAQSISVARNSDLSCPQVCHRNLTDAERDCQLSQRTPTSQKPFCRVRRCHIPCRNCPTALRTNGWCCTTTYIPSTTRSLPPTPIPAVFASVYTNRHVQTFDGLNYNCMLSGEVILVRSLDRKFEVQARFSGLDTTTSATKGVASILGPGPKLSVIIANRSRTSRIFNGCPVLFYVGGFRRDLFAGAGRARNRVKVTAEMSGLITFQYRNGPVVSFRVQQSVFFGCHLEYVNVVIPESFVRDNSLIGALGSPNGDARDDWMTRVGSAIPAPRTRSQRIFAAAYNHCTSNWCMTERTDSLFSYEAGTSFDNFNKCDARFPGVTNLNSASAALQSLCGLDPACLIDGIVGGIEESQKTLEVQAKIDQLSNSLSPFRFQPSIILPGRPVNLLVTMDVSRRPARDVIGLERFVVFRVNPETGFADNDPALELEDNGLSINSDDVGGDHIFSNVLAIQSNLTGEVFAFRAIPVVRGAPASSSPLVTTTTTGVRSYSVESGIIAQRSNADSVTVESLQGLELVVVYTWPLDEPDLDTATEFLGRKIGFGCDFFTPYMTFSGDDLLFGGAETVVIRLNEARADGGWDEETVIHFNAGWFARRGGPASLRTYLRMEVTGAEVPGTELGTAIVPGNQRNCSSTPVASLTVKVMNASFTKLTLTTVS